MLIVLLGYDSTVFVIILLFRFIVLFWISRFIFLSALKYFFLIFLLLFSFWDPLSWRHKHSTFTRISIYLLHSILVFSIHFALCRGVWNFLPIFQCIAFLYKMQNIKTIKEVTLFRLWDMENIHYQGLCQSKKGKLGISRSKVTWEPSLSLTGAMRKTRGGPPLSHEKRWSSLVLGYVKTQWVSFFFFLFFFCSLFSEHKSSMKFLNSHWSLGTSGSDKVSVFMSSCV